MKKLVLFTLTLTIVLAAGAAADDLYKVTLHSSTDAEILKAIDADIILRVQTRYVILADEAASNALQQSGLDTELLASDVRRDQLAIDGRHDRKNAERFEVLYEEGNYRLLLAGLDRLTMEGRPVEAYPVPDRYVKVEYNPPVADPLPEVSTATLDEIDDLVAEISQDSLESYVLALQDFYVRLPDTDPAHDARDWLADKFAEFGYDSVVVDTFVGEQIWSYTPCLCYNVMAYKVGTTLPDQKIIIGGHWDAVPESPGADDNASGTAAVLEMARVLKDIETSMTIIFIALDAEEAGLLGAYHYAGGAAARHEDIVLMINSDMIAHLTNTNRANIYVGSTLAYASVWADMASAYGGITITDFLSGGSSDQRAFWEAGYNAMFVQEDIFSPNWHDPTDSTVYMNFDYMTRMVRATAATAYTVDQHLPPIWITSVQEPGDGHSQLVNWQPINESVVSYYLVHWARADNLTESYYSMQPPTESSYLIQGLTEGVEYRYFVSAHDSEGNTSLTHHYAYSTPSSVPAAPENVTALPLRDAIRVQWAVANEELDFDHCSIVRDGDIVASVTSGNYYIDDDPALGTDLHYYYVVAVDTDNNQSDTVGIPPAWMKAATLQPDRILAVNRTSIRSIDFVDEQETGAFMREALEGYNYDYYSDTVATTKPWLEEQLDLIDMVDYGVIIVGAEAGRVDDIGVSPDVNGILDTLAYYMSIGGKVIIFGRWGHLDERDTVDYTSTLETYDDAYHDYFHIDYRVRMTTVLESATATVLSDFVGARSRDRAYPHLPWDSAATLAHATAQAFPITNVSGIPCGSFAELTSDEPEVIYTYDCSRECRHSKGRPAGWRYLGSDYQYFYFNLPLSCLERSAAKTALRQAVDDLMAAPPVDSKGNDGENVPNAFELSQNYPNPFNPTTEIVYSLPARAQVSLSIYNVLGQRVRRLVDEVQPAGRHTVSWDGTGDNGEMLATGIYLYQLKAGDLKASKKMLLLK